MASHEELAKTYEAAAIDDVGPLVARGAELLALERPGTEQLGELLAEAWIAGTEAAQDETVRRAAGVGAKLREAFRQLPGKPTI